MKNCMLVTGGAGFIGSNFVLCMVERGWKVVNLDKVTYAGNPGNLAPLTETDSYTFVHGDICDSVLVRDLMTEHRPSAVVHLAAETHVDRSISRPEVFLRSNIDGTFMLLEAARDLHNGLQGGEAANFRFLHVSTDEVYGTLRPGDPAFCEKSPYAPNSPYAASKAASDHLVRAWVNTYALPAIITNCSNNYGPFQFPEKLIPLMIARALKGEPLPVYGDGQQIRDWLFVRDHCTAIEAVLQRGRVGETYNIGGGNERTNLDVVTAVCGLLDELVPTSTFRPHAGLIQYVTDRPGHDLRYAIDARKLESELGWHAQETFETGLRKTVEWYVRNAPWMEKVTSGEYKHWMDQNYRHRDVVRSGSESGATNDYNSWTS